MKRILSICIVLVLLLCTAASAEESVYEYAFARRSSEYTTYYVFDTDGGIVRYFSSNDTGVMAGTFVGTLESGVTITWTEGWEESFKRIDNHAAILVDAFGQDYCFCPHRPSENCSA